MKRVRSIMTGIVGLGLVSLAVMISRLAGCAGTGGLFGTGGGGGSGAGQGGTQTVVEKSEAGKDKGDGKDSSQGPRTLNRLGIDITDDVIVINVYIVGEQIELEGRQITPKQLTDTLTALRVSHPNKRLRVVANSTQTARMNVYANIADACKGLAEFNHPAPPK